MSDEYSFASGPPDVMFEPILVPPGWDATQDDVYAKDLLGCAVDGWRDGFERINGWQHEVSDLLAAAFNFLCLNQHAAMALDLSALPLVESLAVVESQCARTESPIDRARCMEALHVLRWVDQERGRILGGLFRAFGSQFIYPLLRLADRLTTAFMDLEEALVLGLPGFEEFWREWREVTSEE